MVKFIDKYLDIELSLVTVKRGRRLQDLINLLSSSEWKLKLEDSGLNVDLSDLKYRHPKLLILLYAFINTTPSDFYEVMNN